MSLDTASGNGSLDAVMDRGSDLDGEGGDWIKLLSEVAEDGVSMMVDSDSNMGDDGVGMDLDWVGKGSGSMVVLGVVGDPEHEGGNLDSWHLGVCRSLDADASAEKTRAGGTLSPNLRLSTEIFFLCRVRSRTIMISRPHSDSVTDSSGDEVDKEGRACVLQLCSR